jgi:hypothetical protein
MKTFTLSIATVMVALGVSVCSAQKPESRRGERDAGAQQRQRPATRQGGQAGNRDPAQMVARMMEEFDKDGDQKLDAKELTALLASMRERREGGQGARRGGREGGQGQGNPGAQRQRRQREAGGAGNAGGERPKRPADE